MSVPDLDTLCSRHFTYRQLIECGDTQRDARPRIPNLPQQSESYLAMQNLAIHILDPVRDEFGALELTYGFCSGTLEKVIPGRISPKHDQHAAHEQRSTGRSICDRLGAAADFLVPGADMRVVADWVLATLPFDRLYFYGRDRPIHVSYSATPSRTAFEMRLYAPERRVPVRMRMPPVER